MSIVILVIMQFYTVLVLASKWNLVCIFFATLGTGNLIVIDRSLLSVADDSARSRT